MEKTMSVEEKIRRAEEIYNRRNNAGYVPNEAKTYRKQNPIIKMIKRIIMCFLIYIVFYVYTNSNYIFSEEFLNKTQEIFNKNTNITQIYNNIKQYINNNILNNVDNSQKAEPKESEQEENIGGAEENEVNEQEQNVEVEQKEEESQMEKDAKEIKEKISFIKPIEGKISSTFGWRTPTTSTVPKYHTGLDIANETGTIIKSATDGIVLLASSEGDYGNHYKIQIEDVTIIYAHCSKLYLNQGDKVTQGQDIAEVGSTGNSTGPHLHFEIRKGERLVDPQLILDI